jgi:excisionase family DNA binding protein
MGADMSPNSSAGGAAPRDPAHRKQSWQEEMRFFTIAAVAEFVGVSRRTVRRWIDDEKLVAHRFGAAVRIAEYDLRAFLAAHRGDKA